MSQNNDVKMLSYSAQSEYVVTGSVGENGRFGNILQQNSSH